MNMIRSLSTFERLCRRLRQKEARPSPRVFNSFSHIAKIHFFIILLI